MGIEQLPRYMQNNPEAYRDAIAQAVMQQQAPADTQAPNPADPYSYIGCADIRPEHWCALVSDNNASFDDAVSQRA